jgi:hypothetical protein
MMSLPNQDATYRGGDVFNQDQLVRDHIHALRVEAAEERFARSQHAHPADAPPGYGRPGVRGVFGRALIALGTAIAASSMDEGRARRGTGGAA